MKVQFRSSFAKDLRGVTDKGLLKRIRETIEEVEQAESLRKVANIKRLKGGGNYYRLRVGDCRLGLVAEGDVVTFVRCLDRKNIYRYFP